MNDENDSPVAELVLESPSELNAPITPLGQAIFGAESLGIMAAKLTLADSLLKMVTKDLRFSDFTREILMLVMQVVKCEAGSIFEVNYNDNTLFFRAATGRSSDQVSHFTLPMGQGVVGYVAESRQPILVADTQTEQRHSKTISQAVNFEAHNLVAVPLIVRGKTYGVLELLNRVGETTFTQADLELLTYGAELISKAIEVRLMINWTRQTAETGSKAA